MKTIQTKFFLFFFILSLLFGMVGCKKGDEVTLMAKLGWYEAGTKVGVVDYSPFWNDGDLVFINGESASVTVNAAGATLLVPTAEEYWGFYPSEYVVSAQNGEFLLDIPKLQEYSTDANRQQRVMAPMGGYSDNNKSIQFSPMGALLKIMLTNQTGHNGLIIDKVSLRSSAVAVWGRARASVSSSGEGECIIEEPYQKGVNDSILLAAPNEASMGIRIDSGQVQEIFVFLPTIAVSNNHFALRIFAHDPRNEYVYDKTLLESCGGVVQRKKLITELVFLCDSSEHIVTAGALNGIFTINGKGGKVRFSRGNLQFQNYPSVTHMTVDGEAQGGWRFADHQYDIIGEDNSLVESSYWDWIDLFGWGTSGFHDAADPYNSSYMPYCYSSFYNYENVYNYYGYGPSTNMQDPNLVGSSANYDWGVYNAIENGGNQPGLWRTLTYNEWYYLLFTRPNAAQKMATGRIKLSSGRYVNGCILIPDEWVLPFGCSFESRMSDNTSDYSANTYTHAQWSLMESNGAVFLPAAGYRNVQDIYSVGINGRYWSSTYDNAGSAYILNFYGNEVRMTDFDRSRGRSVRLVRAVEGL